MSRRVFLLVFDLFSFYFTPFKEGVACQQIADITFPWEGPLECWESEFFNDICQKIDIALNDDI